MWIHVLSFKTRMVLYVSQGLKNRDSQAEHYSSGRTLAQLSQQEPIRLLSVTHSSGRRKHCRCHMLLLCLKNENSMIASCFGISHVAQKCRHQNKRVARTPFAIYKALASFIHGIVFNTALLLLLSKKKSLDRYAFCELLTVLYLTMYSTMGIPPSSCLTSPSLYALPIPLCPWTAGGLGSPEGDMDEKEASEEMRDKTSLCVCFSSSSLWRDVCVPVCAFPRRGAGGNVRYEIRLRYEERGGFKLN